MFGVTTGPENPLFKYFKNSWQHIDKSKPFKVLHIPNALKERAASVIVELKSMLLRKGYFVRDDYKECVTNTLALLGASSQATTVHYKPGATHHARWVGVILFCQKMYMRSEQMAYTPERVNLLARINVFIAIFYGPLWLKSNNGSEAAINDMFFIHSMLDFESIDAIIATAALQKILKHSWYLVEETVIYALFSDTLNEECKKDLAQKLLSLPCPNFFSSGPSYFG